MIPTTRYEWREVVDMMSTITAEDHQAMETILSVKASGKSHRVSMALYFSKVFEAEYAVKLADAYYAIRMMQPVLHR